MNYINHEISHTQEFISHFPSHMDASDNNVISVVDKLKTFFPYWTIANSHSNKNYEMWISLFQAVVASITTFQHVS
jgi:hypothetical protein